MADETTISPTDGSNPASSNIPEAEQKNIVPPLSETPIEPVVLKKEPENIAETKLPPINAAAEISNANVPKDENLPRDIAKILQDVKLPEREQFRGSADLPPPSVTTPRVAETLGKEKAPLPPPARSVANETTVTPLHTLKDDLQHVVREQKISVVRAAALEEDRRTARGTSAAKTDVHAMQRRRIFGIITTIVILVVLGGGALLGVSMIRSERAGSGAPALPSDSLLFSEQTVPFPIGSRESADIKRMLADARVSAALTLGAITRVAPTIDDIDSGTGAAFTRLATTKEFLDSIDAHAPDELIRALGKEFFFGFHTVDENAPVLIVPVTSYEHAFAGMLQWEDSMNADLTPIFTSVPRLTQENGLLKQRPFDDLVMRNYDVRALKDDGGEIQLYYSFPTRELLIVAESPYSFTEVLSRLRADRQL